MNSCAFVRCFNDVRALFGRGRCDETLDKLGFCGRGPIRD